MVAFSTAPPNSSQYGLRSVPPPARPRRSGARVRMTVLCGAMPPLLAHQQRRNESGEVAAGEQMPGDAGRGGGLDVDRLVADQQAARRIQPPGAQQIEDHAR